MRVLVVDPNAVRRGELSKAEALAAAGLTVSVLAPRAWRENYRTLHAPAAWSGSYRLVRAPVAGKPPNRCLFLGGWREALRPRPEVVLTLSDENFWPTGQALVLTRLLAPRARFVCHSWRNLCFSPAWHPQPWTWLYRADTWLERRVFAGADLIVARNQAAVAVLRRRGYRGPMALLSWGVDTHQFAPPERKPRARPEDAGGGVNESERGGLGDGGGTPRLASQGARSGRFTIGFVGRFSPEKGLETLLAASARLAAPHRLLLVGGGPLEARVQDWIQRHPEVPAELAPLVDHAQMPELYHRMDVLVLPSRQAGFEQEQFGRALVEAMACGVAVVGSDSGAIPEVVGDGGLIFPAGDALALADRLASLADPIRRAELARRGLRRVRERFSWAAWAVATARMLTDLLAGRLATGGAEAA